MANINVPVSFDANGNVVCRDITAAIGDTITWKPDSATVNNIQSLSVSSGTLNPAPSTRNLWVGTFATAGPIGNNEMGVLYTITVVAKNTQWGARPKTPKIIVSAP